MVKSHLGDVCSHVLHLSIGCGLGEGNLKEASHGRVTDDPVQGLQNMPFHLCEHVVVVERAAHGLQFLDGGHTLFTVAVLGGNEQGGTTHQLVVTLVDDTLRAVSVEQVHGKEESLGEQLEGVVSFEEEVEEVGTHEPLDLGLNLNGVDVRHRLGLLGISMCVQ